MPRLLQHYRIKQRNLEKKLSDHTTNTESDPVEEAATALANEQDSDVFLYNSSIVRPFDDEIISQCSRMKRRKKVTVLLVTEGGDPDAAYRIARCFQQHYSRFTCLVSGYCKSAGTLIAVGANELAMTDAGELGPLDVQLTKKDELWETESGLTVMSALVALHEKAFSAFEHFFLTIKSKSRDTVTFRTAAELAVKLTSGLFVPIFQHIDPMHVGEASRAQAIAQHYAIRLTLYGKNISEKYLENLISSYPSHGFVIDRAEAEALFNNVREPSEGETNLINCLSEKATEPLMKGSEIRGFLSKEKESQNVTSNAPANSSQTETVGATAEIAGESSEQEDITERLTTK